MKYTCLPFEMVYSLLIHGVCRSARCSCRALDSSRAGVQYFPILGADMTHRELEAPKNLLVS